MATEKRLIWDEDAKRRIIALATGFHTDRLPVDMVINVILHQAPTVDAVEVVRCKDCKHYGWVQEHCHGRTQYFCRLHKGLIVVNTDTFCSYGERRTDE